MSTSCKHMSNRDIEEIYLWEPNISTFLMILPDACILTLNCEQMSEKCYDNLTLTLNKNMFLSCFLQMINNLKC